MVVRTVISTFQMRPLAVYFRVPFAYLKNLASAEPSSGLEKPKKPNTPFLTFVAEKKSGLLKLYPNTKSKDLVKLVGKMWGDLSDAEKMKYKRSYESKYDKYKESLAKYEEMKNIEELEKIRTGEVLDKKTLSKHGRLLGRPSRPSSVFLKFFTDFRQTVGKSTSVQEMLKLATQKWKELDNIDKQKYVIQQKQQLEEYNKQMDEWEENMIKKGYGLLVRAKTLKENKISKKEGGLTKVDL